MQASIQILLQYVHVALVFFFLCVRQVERYTLTLDNEKLMFMVALNDGNYLQQTITLVLIFCRCQRTPVPSFVKKTKQKKTKQNKTKQKKKTDRQPGQRRRYLAGNIESCCISLCVSSQIQFINGHFSIISLVFVQYRRLLALQQSESQDQ